MKGFGKRLCALSLSVVMLLTSGACAVQKGGGQTAVPDTKKTQTAAPAQTQGDAGDTAGTVASGDEVTFKVGYARSASFEYQGDETMEDNTWTRLYKEHGVNLDVIYNVDSSQGEEKLAQSIMAGDYPDIMTVNAKYYTEWASQGVFTDLTEAFELYASDELKEFYNSEAGERALKAATVDGKLYGIPGITTPTDGMPLLWIRKDWLDHLGLDIPETVDDFYAIAKAFTENDPDQNGQDDTYGLALNGKDVFTSTGDIGTYFEMFGVQPGYYTNNIPFVEKDGKAVYGGADSEAMKEGLALLQDMYQNGYISRDFITAGGDQIDQDMSAGKVGMAFSWFAAAQKPWQNALETQPDVNIISVPIPGITAQDRGQAFYTASPQSYITLSSQNDNIEKFFEVVNLGLHYMTQLDKLTQEEYEMYNGLPGKYTGFDACLTMFWIPFKNSMSWARIQEALKTGDTSKMNPENLRDYNAMRVYYDNRDRRDELTEEELGAFNGGLLYWVVYGNEHCAYQSLDEMAKMDNFQYSAFEASATEKMNEYTTTLTTLTKETIIDIIIGNRDVDAYDDFLESWNSLGGAEITAEADAWFQSSKAN